MKVSVEIGSLMGSFPAENLWTMSRSSACVVGQSVGGIWNAVFSMNAWLLGES